MNNTELWLKTNCPLIWHTLNHKAKKSLPKGITDFLETGPQYAIEKGKQIFLIIEDHLKILVDKINANEVHNTYRRDFSGVRDEKQLREIFSEIAVCSTIAKISSTIILRPKLKNDKHSDFKVKISYYNIYGEIKRLEDKTKLIGRSILTDNNFKSRMKTMRPRFQELYSKLENAFEQLPLNKINIIFLFHPSNYSTVNYIQQALFGQGNFWNQIENLKLESNSLFAKEEWKNVSAVFLCEVGNNNFVKADKIFKNPRAIRPLKNKLLERFRTHF